MNWRKEFIYEEAFSRNIGLLSEEEQQTLKKSVVAIAGLGGVGGVYLIVLTRMGIGNFHIADFDRFELANMNRQMGASMDTLGREKIEVMVEMAESINPSVSIKKFPGGIDESNIDEFLKGVDVALDGVDFFAIDARTLLFRKAREHGIYAITSAPIGFGATLHVFAPDRMTFEDYFGIRPDMAYDEKIISFGIGLAPRLAHIRYFPPSKLNLTDKRAPSLCSSCFLCAGIVASETVNIILKKRKIRAAPYCIQYDPFSRKYKKGYVFWGSKNPLQRLKKWWALRRIR